MHRSTIPRSTSLTAAAGLALFALSACTDATTVAPLAPGSSALSAAQSAAVGGVFVSTNAATGNAVVAFARAADGTLTPRGSFPTGDNGSGGTVDPLASQAALVLSGDARRLYVVNAGSSSITTFAVAGGDLVKLATVPSGGTKPVSLAVSGSRLFALNAASNAIAEFALDQNGVPASSPAATANLATPASGASTIGVSPDGSHVVVTERDANAIDVFTVAPDGSLSAPVTTQSSGDVPFGFGFTPRGQLVVSEVAGAAPNGATSSYSLSSNGTLTPITESLSTQQAATCWLVVTESGRFAFAVNSASGSISSYAVNADGTLSLVDADGRTGISGAGAKPIDAGLSRDGRFLFALEAGTGTIGAFAVSPDGHLTSLPDTPGPTPASGQQGLAAY
jgi:6-phosphogluconolactonase (cycloisomerase 2 family)